MSVQPPTVDLTDTTPSTQRVYRILDEADHRLTRAEIAARADITKATVATAVKTLRKKQLVDIGHDPQNPRAERLTTTEDGR